MRHAVKAPHGAPIPLRTVDARALMSNPRLDHPEVFFDAMAMADIALPRNAFGAIMMHSRGAWASLRNKGDDMFVLLGENDHSGFNEHEFFADRMMTGGAPARWMLPEHLSSLVFELGMILKTMTDPDHPDEMPFAILMRRSSIIVIEPGAERAMLVLAKGMTAHEHLEELAAIADRFPDVFRLEA